MPKSDWDYFNCSEQHEYDYVVGLYAEKADVRRTLAEWCQNGTINNTTHQKLYEMLNEAGFTKIK